MEKKNCRFHSAETARSFIRSVAYEIDDPELMLEFLTALDISNATLVSWLIEENRGGASYQTIGVFEEFQLAAERLRAVLKKVNDAKSVAGSFAATKPESWIEEGPDGDCKTICTYRGIRTCGGQLRLAWCLGQHDRWQCRRCRRNSVCPLRE